MAFSDLRGYLEETRLLGGVSEARGGVDWDLGIVFGGNFNAI